MSASSRDNNDKQLLDCIGVEIVALPPPSTPPSTPPSPPYQDIAPLPSRDKRTLSTASPYAASPRTQLAISESMEQGEIITPPRLPDGRKQRSAVGAAGSIKGDAKLQQRYNRQNTSSSQQQQQQQQQQHKTSSTANNNSNSSNNNNRKNAAIVTSSPSKLKSGKKPKGKLSYIEMARLGYKELVHAIIRPPRSKYPLEALGAETFRFCGEQFERKDFGVVNERGLLIECSMWQRVREGSEGSGSGYHTPEQEVVVDDEPSLFVRQESEVSETPARGRIQFIPRQRTRSLNDSVDRSDSSAHSVEKGQVLYLSMPDSNETEDTAVSSTQSKQQDDHDKPFPRRSSIFSPKSKSSSSSSKPSISAASKPLERRPVVIYLHGNSSSRTEVIPQLGHLLALGLTVVAFDFCGSGHSEGDFVSLGYYEREDLQTVINYLRASGTVSSIALWGRSMGAATALMYASRDPTISCMILDSPFIDLATLAQELVERGKEHGVHVPQIVVSMVMRMLKSSVKQEARFNIKHISPVSHAPKCFIPAMIVAGEHDDFIKKRHAQVIHKHYAGDKNLVIVDGDHNSPRPRYMVQGAMLFLQSCMKVSASLELIVPSDTSLLSPPWLSPENLRMLSTSLKLRRGTGSGRFWLPVEDPRYSSQEEKKQQQQQQRLLAPPSINDEDGGCFSRSSTDLSRSTPQQNAVAPYDVTGATLPDMSKRQQEIQSSLFKMLGEDELPMK